MLKSFVRADKAEDVQFWEHYFAAQSYQYLVNSFYADPLRPLFERYCAGGRLVLEGGCGLGNYLTSLQALGARPVGLDFGIGLLSSVRSYQPAMPLVAGDVCGLPFSSGSFDVYYSGGVMEHFEAGPSPALAEARRVLRSGGILLVSVPYENPIRRSNARRQRVVHGIVSQPVEREDEGASPVGHNFFQYYYRGAEFRKHLIDHGFEVLAEQPYSLWRGLTDVPLLGWIDRKYAEEHERQPQSGGTPSAPQLNGTPPNGNGRLKAALKYAVFAEDRRIPLISQAMSVACELAANMRMYVCRRA